MAIEQEEEEEEGLLTRFLFNARGGSGASALLLLRKEEEEGGAFSTKVAIKIESRLVGAIPFPLLLLPATAKAQNIRKRDGPIEAGLRCH